MYDQHTTVPARKSKSASSRPMYQHTKLRSIERHIRLLRVWRDNHGPIQCNLQEFCLGGHGGKSSQQNTNCPEGCPPVSPDFIAVSYEWGPIDPIKEIEIDGCSLVVRRNLWCLLKNIARGRLPYASNDTHVTRKRMAGLLKDKIIIRKGDVYLWIDQVCIDQTGMTEKSAQIMLMKMIYGTAERVIAWIGPGNEGSHQSMDYLQNRPVSSIPSRTKGSRKKGSIAQWVDIDPNCPQMRHLAQQTYWTRLWIVQEIAAAQRVTIIWGRLEVQHRVWRVQKFEPDNHDRYLDRVLKITKRNDSGNPPGSLLYLCCHFIDHVCMLPHDHVFALSSFCEKEDKPPVDYTRNPCDLFWDLVLLHAKYRLSGPIEIRDLLRFAHAMGVTGDEAGAQGEAGLVFHREWFPSTNTPRAIFAASIEDALEVSWDGVRERTEHMQKKKAHQRARKLAREQAHKAAKIRIS